MTDWDQKALDRLHAQVSDSSMFLSLMTDRWKEDPRALLELGYAIMLEKPLLFAMPEGTVMPRALGRLADDVETYTPETPEAATAAIKRLLARQAARERDSILDSPKGADMPPRLTACATCNAPISNFPTEATRNYGREYKTLVEIRSRTYCSECADKILAEHPDLKG